MRVVVALGGNALLKRGEPLTAENQSANIQRAAAQLARVALAHELILTHGNGPQVGLLALQAAAYADISSVAAYPLDLLGAESQGMIGYPLEQALANRLPPERSVVTLVTRTEVDANDPAFAHPTKPIGPVYTEQESQRLAAEKSWTMAPDGSHFRRVVASPAPLRILNLQAIAWLVEKGALVIAAGGGGIPVVRNPEGQMQGIEAVIDKDLCAALLAQALHADCLVIATDVAAIFENWDEPGQQPIGKISAQALGQKSFAAGSMGPKVQAACQFVQATGKRAAIGSLEQIEALVAGTAGTQIDRDMANQA